MYLWMLVVLLGFFVLLGSFKPLLIPPLFAILIDRRFISPEERGLEQTFGEQFKAYKARVRRWL